MNPKALFILVYFSCFSLLSFITEKILDTDNQSYEMVSYLIWGIILYILIGIPLWMYTIKFSEKFKNSSRFWFCFMGGLFVLYIIMFIGSQSIPLISIITFSSRFGDLAISWALHIIYTVSFLIAYLSYRRNKRRLINAQK